MKKPEQPAGEPDEFPEWMYKKPNPKKEVGTERLLSTLSTLIGRYGPNSNQVIEFIARNSKSDRPEFVLLAKMARKTAQLLQQPKKRD